MIEYIINNYRYLYNVINVHVSVAAQKDFNQFVAFVLRKLGETN